MADSTELGKKRGVWVGGVGWGGESISKQSAVMKNIPNFSAKQAAC